LLQGDHNKENIKAAVTVARLFYIPASTIATAVKTFRPLPHRLEYLGEHKNIEFYNDAIATTPEATIMALRTLKNIGTIFLGGELKPIDYSELEKEILNYGIKNIVLFPDAGDHIITKKEGLNILNTDKMEEAVKWAYEITPKNNICLLSCACPSYSVWKSYEEKGAQFREFVKKYGQT
jgi:UDP-N-acetylmuramoylalanine--D-glutamate ligase